ncbi:MAG: hypothetical protein H6P95_2781 [Candidatus Aminicenantes bacterium]|nr:hypothetical protein [Candidatus Aminicenantes bacterium]
MTLRIADLLRLFRARARLIVSKMVMVISMRSSTIRGGRRPSTAKRRLLVRRFFFMVPTSASRRNPTRARTGAAQAANLKAPERKILRRFSFFF